MARVNVFLMDELLSAIDAEAASVGTNRSALIQDVLSRFLEARRKEREALAVRKEMEDAGRGMDALATKLGDWDPVGVIRSSRDARSFTVREKAARYRPAKRKRRS